ncbi:MAG: hypothetical protein VSS75_004630 [Candidatus Parabeggiatoa sp.]|nr:hypothetical protein [Candidatus Parabeggiatoa sp.]
MSESNQASNKSVETDKTEVDKTDESINKPKETDKEGSEQEKTQKTRHDGESESVDFDGTEEGLEKEKTQKKVTTPEKIDSQILDNITENDSKDTSHNTENDQPVETGGPKETDEQDERGEELPKKLIKKPEYEGGMPQEIDNKGPVKKQTNVAHAHTMNFFGDSKESSKEFKDPTKSLPNKPEGLPSFNSAKEEIEAYFNELKNKRILLVECFDDNILRAATYELLNRAEEHYEKRLLAFEGSQLEQSDLHLSRLVNEKIGSGEKLIIVISLKSKRFLDSLFMEESLSAQSIKEQLEKNDIMLVCFANSGFLQENVLEEKYSNFHFQKWNIPFLPSLLKVHFKDEAKSLEEHILQQRNYGLWDENNSDREFYGLLYGYLINGAEQLRKEVEKRKQYKEGQSVQEFLTEIQTVRPKELFQDDNLVKNTVLYVATFFPGLSRRDFEFIVSLLLKGEKTRVIFESTKKTKKGKIKTVRTIEEKDGIEIWEKSQDKIFEECHLQVSYLETGSHVIEFSLPYLREKLRKHLEQKSLYIRYFEKIQQVHLLIDFEVSSKIIENVITLSAEMAIYEPNHYGKAWLVNIIEQIKQEFTDEVDKIKEHFKNEREKWDIEELDKIISTDSTLIQSLVLNLLSDVKKEEIDLKEKINIQNVQQYLEKIIFRLSELIYKILKYPQLQNMIQDFLHELMREKHHDIVLVIILGIVEKLQYTSEFDGMSWIRQLLDTEESPKEVKEKAYNTLLEQANQSGLRVYELLDTLKKWLPERNLKDEQFSFSNKYALKFIIDYARNTVSHFQEVDYGTWPSKYPLFANLEENQDFTKIDLLISWFFHPKMQYALNELEDDFLKSLKKNDISLNILLAFLIQMWFKILYGLDTKKVRPKSLLSALDRLLQQIVLNTNISQQKELMRYWWGRQAFFTEKIRKIDRAERAERQQLINERKVILELH